MVHVSGSLAFDRILFYQGKFEKHFKAQNASFNISLDIDRIIENYGGTAGNIAYNLSLFNEPVTIYATAGRDFSQYAKRLHSCGISTRGIRTLKELKTATAYMLTDAVGNQLVGFYAGAMKVSAFPQKKPKVKKGDIGIIGAGNEDDMTNLAIFYKKNNIPYLFDPSQQITTMTREQLKIGLSGAKILIVNEGEIARLEEVLNDTRENFLNVVKYIIITRGKKGSILLSAFTKPTPISAVSPDTIIDPTGAGDAYRAGLIKGLLSQYDIVTAAKLGAVTASFCLEKGGTQQHTITKEIFQSRYEKTFGSNCNLYNLFESSDDTPKD